MLHKCLEQEMIQSLKRAQLEDVWMGEDHSCFGKRIESDGNLQT